MIDELNIPEKEDHPDKAAAVVGVDTKYYTTAAEFNNIVDKANELVSAVNDMEVYANKSVTYSYTTPANVIKDYFPNATTVTALATNGVATLSYSTNGGTSYTAISLPFTAPLVLPAGWVLFRITYTPGIVTAGINLTI